MAVTPITDLFARAQARLMLQYKTLTKFVADVGVVISEAQVLENMLQDFTAQLDIDTAEGWWLDRIGKYVGEAREGLVDDYASSSHIPGYREMVKARILANASHGTSEDIIAVATQAVDPIGVGFTLVDWYPAAQVLTVDSTYPLGGQNTDVGINRIMRVLAHARAVAVQLMILFQDDEDDTIIFVCGDATGGSVTGLGFDNAASPNDPTAGRFAGAVNT